VKSYRKFATLVVSAAVPLGMVASLTLGGSAFAAGRHRQVHGKAASGVVTCTPVSASINFKPPLLPTGTSKEKTTTTVSSLGTCTVKGGAGGTVTDTSVKIAISGGSGTNSCASFASNTGSDSIKETVKWAGGIAPTNVTFAPGSISVAAGDKGFNATGGNATGSFATSSASFDVTLASISALVACIGGSGSVSSLQVNGGSATA